MTLAPSEILNNRYRIISLLGQGGYGAVYRAWDMNLQKACAVKENLETSMDQSIQFMREATTLANLAHSHLPRVIDYFSIPQLGQYLVMDFVEGENLDNKVGRTGPLHHTQAVYWIGQIADALDYLHNQPQPLIHRDVKPANIIITHSGQAILVDFGLIKIYNIGKETAKGARGVTPGYSPPEQYGVGLTDARSDIYSLGATLYTLLTGATPPESVEIVAGSAKYPIPAHLRNSQIPPELSEVIQQAMHLDASKRFQTVEQFKGAMYAALPQSLPGVPSRPGPVAVPVGAQPAAAQADAGVRPPSSPQQGMDRLVIQSPPAAQVNANVRPPSSPPPAVRTPTGPASQPASRPGWAVFGVAGCIISVIVLLVIGIVGVWALYRYTTALDFIKIPAATRTPIPTETATPIPTLEPTMTPIPTIAPTGTRVPRSTNTPPPNSSLTGDLSSCNSAAYLPLDQTVSGSVVGDQRVCYAIEATGNTLYSFVVDSPTDTDTVLEVYDDEGTFLAYDDDSGGRRNPLLAFTPELTNIYYVLIYSYGSSATGEYVLSYRSGYEFCPNAQPIQLETVIDDTLATNEKACYSFLGAYGQPIFAYVTSEIDTSIRLYDEWGGEVSFNDDADNLNPIINLALPWDGTFTIAIQSFSGDPGAYNLNFGTGATNSFENAILLSPNVSTPGDISFWDAIFLEAFDYTGYGDFYYFDGSAGQTVQIDALTDSTVSGMDSWIGLFDETGQTLLADNDNRDENTLDSQIYFTLPSAGRYYVLIIDNYSGYAYDDYYSYELWLTYP